jgi:transposase-like protein
MRKRRKFEPEFKAQVVLELLRGEKTMAQFCREDAIGADLLGQWRKNKHQQASGDVRPGRWDYYRTKYA